MTCFEYNVVIERPVEDVWAYVIDPGNDPVWQGAIVEVRRGAGVPLHVDSEIEVVAQLLGRTFQATLVVTELEPMRRFGVRTSAGPVPMQGTYHLEPVERGTRFTVEGQTDAHGFFKVAEPLFARRAHREWASSCETLKDLLEAEVRTISP